MAGESNWSPNEDSLLDTGRNTRSGIPSSGRRDTFSYHYVRHSMQVAHLHDLNPETTTRTDRLRKIWESPKQVASTGYFRHPDRRSWI